jgi:hypothetical protein
MKEIEYNITYQVRRFEPEFHSHWMYILNMKHGDGMSYNANALVAEQFYLLIEFHDWEDDWEDCIIGYATIDFDALDYIQIDEPHRGKGKLEPIMHQLIEKGVRRLDNAGAEEELMNMIMSKYGLLPTMKKNPDGTYSYIR